MVAARYGFKRIVLSDIVEDALRFAKANVLRNNLQDQVEVRFVDVTTPGRDPAPRATPRIWTKPSARPRPSPMCRSAWPP